MLGKTNITTLSESAIITEIEDYRWIQMQSGVFGNFVKAIYKNGYLVGITADGTVAYTTDGEAWQTHILDYEDCKLNDIDWDGSRFILVGSCTDNRRETSLILAAESLEEYERIQIENENDSESKYDIEYHAIYPFNGKYLVIATRNESGYIYVYAYIGDLVNEWKTINKLEVRGHRQYNSCYYTQNVAVAKNSSEMLIHVYYYGKVNSNTYWYNEIQKVNNEGVFNYLYYLKSSQTPIMNVYECKDSLFYESMVITDNYMMVKVLTSNETSILSTEQNFAFVDGVYFNECQIFINNHEMMIVKRGESIADKTKEDLIEIAPEITMNCIAKAFGQLYIFGNQGVILRSSVETNNDEVITVQALSAKKALLEAKKYTDERYTDLINFVGSMKPFTKDVDVNLNGTTAVKVLALDGTEECGGYTEENIKFITAIVINRGASLSTPMIATMPGDNSPYIYIYNAENKDGPCKIRIHIE